MEAPVVKALHAVVVLAAGFLPASSRGALLGTDGAPVPRVELRETVVAVREGGVHRVESWVLRGPFRRLVWFEPLPQGAQPFEPSPGTLGTLLEATRPHRPHADRIEAQPLGPSLLTRLMRRSSEDAAVSSLSAPRPARPIDAARFRGAVQTSTRTESGLRELLLPEDLERLLQRHGLRLDRRVREAVGQHLSAGRTIRATVWRGDPGSPVHRLGPVGRSGVEDWVPVDLADPETAGRLVVLADTAYGVKGPGTVKPERPWRLATPKLGERRLVYARPLDPDAAFDLPEPLWPAGGRAPVATRIDWAPRGEITEPLRLEPRSPVAEVPATVPGEAADVWLCVLLGLTPLFYAPESWFLLWVQTGVRERTRSGRGWPFTRIWAVWPALVGVYWLSSMDGAGRWAAVLPCIAALAAAFWPERPRTRFIRASFEKKKKA